MPNFTLDDMMRKVEGLLAKADSTDSDEEAATLRAAAERIMIRHKIVEEDLLQRGDLKQDDLHVLFKEVRAYPMNAKYASVYQSLMSYAVHHADCYGVWTGYDWSTGDRVMTIVGYEADIRYAEALYMGARLLFADRMEPKVDPSLSDQENVYRLRSAGLERRKVAEMMGWVKGGAKVTRLYKAACDERGEDPALTGRGTSVKDFKDAYTDAFTLEFWTRLYNAKNAIDQETGGGLVLHGRLDRIKEAAYQRWPELRPTPLDRAIGEEPKRKAQRLYKETAADRKRAARRYTAGGQAGIKAGRKAASEVDVKGTTPTRRLNESEG